MEFRLEDIASNRPLSREECKNWPASNVKMRPTCTCLREIETGAPRTMFCFMPCKEQQEIIEAREKLKIHTK